MGMLIFVIVVIVIFVVIFKIAESKKPRFESVVEKPPYFQKKTLLNEKEQIIFHRLIDAMPNFYVFTQVRLADIVGIKKCENRQAWFNKVNQKSVDFVICNKALTVRVCIELDGKTHENADRQKADNDKDEALQAAGIPIVRIEASKMPSTEEIKAMLEQILLH